MADLGNRTKREEFVLEAVHKQLEIAGVDPSVLETDRENWFSNNTMTEEHRNQWKNWFISEVRKKFKLPKKMAEREFDFFDLTYGLKIKDGSAENC